MTAAGTHMPGRVLTFAQELIRAEHAARVAHATQPDADAYQHARDYLRRFLAPDVGDDLDRPSAPNSEWFEQGNEGLRLGSIAPRALLTARHYQHPQHGHLFNLYMSLPIRLPDDQLVADAVFVIRPSGDQFQVIARYDRDILGQPGSLLDDGETRWILHSGTPLEITGQLVASYEPEHPLRSEAN